MPSYVVVGASRGIGFALLKALSSETSNTVIGIVRNKVAAEDQVNKEIRERNNVHIISGDLTDPQSLKGAVEEVSKITGGSLDVLVANAAIGDACWVPIGEQITNDIKAFDKDMLDCFNINVIGTSHALAFFVPLLRRGTLKKAVVLGSGAGEPDLVADYGWYSQAPYAISKAALTMVVAKFHAQYRHEGILFMAVSPGIVDTGFVSRVDPSDGDFQKALADQMRIATTSAPEFKGPMTPDESVKMLHDVVENATMGVNGGKMVSHFGNKKWI